MERAEDFPSQFHGGAQPFAEPEPTVGRKRCLPMAGPARHGQRQRDREWKQRQDHRHSRLGQPRSERQRGEGHPAGSHPAQAEDEQSLQAQPPAAFVFFDAAPLLSEPDASADFARHCPAAAAWVSDARTTMRVASTWSTTPGRRAMMVTPLSRATVSSMPVPTNGASARMSGTA